MDTYRALVAILISFLILIGYQYFFVGFQSEEAVVEGGAPQQNGVRQQPQTQAPVAQPPQLPAAPEVPAAVPQPMTGGEAKKITVDTPLYTAVLSEAGGTVTSFVLKNHRETSAEDSPGKQLIENPENFGYPLKFSWGSAMPADSYYRASESIVEFENNTGELHMTATTPAGLLVEKVFHFKRDSYVIELDIRVSNPTQQALQGSPQLYQVNVPFEERSTFNRFLFIGPAAYRNGELKEYKAKEFEEGPKSVQGVFDWVAYEGTYFMCAIIPETQEPSTFVMQGNEDIVYTQFSGGLDTLNPNDSAVYQYRLFYGPKKLSLLKEIGYNLDRSIDFGWFDFIAKPLCIYSTSSTPSSRTTASPLSWSPSSSRQFSGR